MISSLLVLVGLIAAGVALGVTLSKTHHATSSAVATHGSTGAENGDGSSDGPTGAVNQTDPNDPSSFEKNPLLKHSFYGLAYTPSGSQLPECGNSLGASIHVFASDCSM